MKKTIAILMACLIVMCTVAGISVYASDNIAAITNSESVAEAAAIKWLNDNYKEVYILRNVKAYTERSFETSASKKYYVTITCETLLKFNDVEDLPFVQGMREEIAQTEEVTRSVNTAINSYIEELESYIGEYTPFTIHVAVEISRSKVNDVTIYLYDNQSSTLYPINIASVDIAAMKDDGHDVAKSIVASANLTRGYPAYDRIAARDYALTYTSSPQFCVDCGETSVNDNICSNKLDSSKWNNAEYWVYGDPLLHGNCADYVSQAMHAGGIPIDAGLWDRYNDANNGWAWTEPNAQRSYMLGKGYWEASTFAAANAGNIICWLNGTSVYHVAMITLNDTVTHRYSAHTYDEHNTWFGSGMTCAYYVIETD